MKLDEALGHIRSDKRAQREGAFAYLLNLSEHTSRLLYPDWDLFVEMLREEKIFSKCIAVRLPGNLVRGDCERRFEKIYDLFYSSYDNKKGLSHT